MILMNRYVKYNIVKEDNDMTIDEAIAHAREVASEQRRRSGTCTTNDNECDKFSNCMKCAEEHEQLAEWLEELKDYREIGTVEGYKSAIKCYTEEYTIRKSNKQYNKAIDDLMEKASECNMSSADWNYLVQEAKQLKAGGENGID